jgi:arylsulfatase A-like enzyme
MDWSVGEVLEALRTQGLAEKTLVIFTSDNGGTDLSVNKPLRGHKGTTWEGGMRGPSIAWWPGKIPAGTESDAICGMFDVLPTCVALSGGKVPADRKLDGKNLWPILSGEAGAAAPHESFLYFKGLVLEAVREGKWKLHLAKGQLFDLAADPGEATNVADANPDTVAKLRALADATDGDLGRSGIGPGVRALGKVENAQPLIGHDGRPRAGFEPK